MWPTSAMKPTIFIIFCGVMVNSMSGSLMSSSTSSGVIFSLVMRTIDLGGAALVFVDVLDRFIEGGEESLVGLWIFVVKLACGPHEVVGRLAAEHLVRFEDAAHAW